MLSLFMSVRHFFFNSIFFFIACLFLGCGLNGGSVQAQTIGQPHYQTTAPTPDRLSLDDRLATQHRIHAILASQPGHQPVRRWRGKLPRHRGHRVERQYPELCFHAIKHAWKVKNLAHSGQCPRSGR